MAPLTSRAAPGSAWHAAAALVLAATLAACGPEATVRPSPPPGPARVYAPATADLPIRPPPVLLPAPPAESASAVTTLPLAPTAPPIGQPAPGLAADAAQNDPGAAAPPALMAPLPFGAPLPLGELPQFPETRRLPTRIALVLPLQSPTFGPAAEAVAAGFSAAAKLAKAPVTIIPHGDGGVLPAMDKAWREGATVIVGPLLRDDLKAVASAGIALPWTIALNQLDDAVALPTPLYSFALSVEGEARQIARTMQADGVRDVGIVAAESPLQQRFAASFTDEWLAQGGGRPSTFRLVRDPESLAVLRTELGRNRVDAVLLAGGGSDAALVKPYLPQVKVYASSQVHDRQPTAMLRDLDGIRFVEVPLVGTPDAPELAGVPRQEFANPTLERLYALGYDALHVALAFERGPPQRLELQGATGQLVLAPGHHIVRAGRLMRFEAGQVVPDDRP
ncbi:MAG: penicillin-binding protein activator [Casimicrobiaceae bacterium]